MVLILDGTSEIGAHVRSNFCLLTCLRHLSRAREEENLFFLAFAKDLFSFMRAQHVLSYHLIYVPWVRTSVCGKATNRKSLISNEIGFSRS